MTMNKLTDNTPMPYGKHKGTAMANVPAGYLLWLLESGKCFCGVKEYVIDNLDVLRQEKENLR